jgi:hypothetical protein
MASSVPDVQPGKVLLGAKQGPSHKWEGGKDIGGDAMCIHLYLFEYPIIRAKQYM